VATDCAARGGSTGLHSGPRTSRIAGLLCRPRAGRHVHGCHEVGVVPGRRRHGEIAAVGRARRGPAGPPRSGVRAGAGLPRKSSSLHGPQAAVAGPAGGPDRPESAGS
jgi:hypothetical protein